MADHDIVTAVEKEIDGLPANLRESALSAAAYMLAVRLKEATARDSTGIAKELRTTLERLHELANSTAGEDDAVEKIRNRHPDSHPRN